ncbi:hypothetical protein L249_8269 [Ophiocordyceps polyrhachis-furcata BCC 54312]|uniref:Uncharacterized protein n=1 Tax=Ophiocordyceps polyrhachis-furcata BCC 54312 TaxID=1330021 RepID=A0A367LHF1_9HYPO|nr:hypothetical protein L249_8269 [Ophiocordyceps polyrhachis-furcata BCC 54312]
MAKSKSSPGVQNRAIFSRASYLYQAATYLSQRAATTTTSSSSSSSQTHQRKQLRNLSRRAISEMRAVTRKAQIRQSHPLKRSLCTACNTLLVEGDTCQSTIENPSKGARKPWADVLVVRCVTCSRPKRFPISAPRQTRAALRRSASGSGSRSSGNSASGTTGEREPSKGEERGEVASLNQNEDSSRGIEMKKI